MPEEPEDQTEERRDLLAYALFRISPRSGVQISPNDRDKIWRRLTRKSDAPGSRDPLLQLEQRFVERLVPRVGIPVKVQLFPRRRSIELAVVIFGAYSFLKDYKPLRDSLALLSDDIKSIAAVPDNWEVVVEDVLTPSNTVPETSGGSVSEPSRSIVGMAMASRYAFVYLLIINVLALIFFCYLTLTAVMAKA